MMNIDEYTYRDGELFAEDAPVRALAETYGTPLYIYSRSHLRRQYAALTEAMADVRPLICYSVKGNSNRAVLQTFAELGAGADVVSGGELRRALNAGFPAEKIAFAGVGKTVEEIDAAIDARILFFTVESEAELERIGARASARNASARVAVRVNPDVDPRTHKYTTTGTLENKFGVDLERAERVYDRVLELPGIEPAGIHMHLGSPLANEEPYVRALEKTAPLCRRLRERCETFRHIDIGGGLGIPYRPGEPPFDLDAFRRRVAPLLRDTGLEASMEPGRFLTGNAGILVSRVQYVKENPLKKFVIIDASMTDLIRPPLYEAYHHILPVRETGEHITGDLVGPVCESGDFMAKDRLLPAVAQDDLLAIMSAGAYGYVMASNYNSRRRPAEVMVEGARHALVRERETADDLTKGEHAFC